MYVCICNEVTNKEIENAASLGACSIKDLRHSLNVGTTCGQCVTCVKGLLKEYQHSLINIEMHPI